MATAPRASSESSFGFPVKGSLKRHPFPRIMREISRRKLAGSLYLLSGQTKKVVFFEDGQPVFVRSNVLSECLGQILATEGLITQEQCEQTLEAIRRTGKKQGELLVEMGILSEGNLRYGLDAQLRTKLYDIFSWEEGRYQFKPGAINQAVRVRFGTSSEGIIIDAVVERWSEQRATQSLDMHRERYPVRKLDGNPKLDLLPEEQHFLACMDGSRTVSEVLRSPPQPAPPSTACLLAGALQAGVLQLSEKQLAARQPPPAPELRPPSMRDEDLTPVFEPTNTLTEYEDTPLPGQLPQAPSPQVEEDDFAGVEDDETSSGTSRSEVDEALLAAEPSDVEEAFGDEIELLDDDSLEVVDDRGGDGLGFENEPSLEWLAAELEQIDEDLVFEGAQGSSLDDGNLASEFDDETTSDPRNESSRKSPSPRAPANVAPSLATTTMNPEIEGAMRFSEAETALSHARHADAARLLEEAYELGFDVPELHAMLAYARFMAQPGDDGRGALDLLDYAETMDPALDLVHAYRGAIYRNLGQRREARAALERALEINPYCELASRELDALQA